MGTIVLKKHDEIDDTFDIVDGQQRIPTFSILFSIIASIGEVFQNNPNIFLVEKMPKRVKTKILYTHNKSENTGQPILD